jgi:N,N'-diacetyllegionaminate synthase
MVKVIAEIGWNHLGDMNLAKEMILAAKESGATYAKFQTWSVSRLKPGAWDFDGRREIYEKAELTKERHVELIEYCKQVGIEFLSSVFSIKDAELLLELGIQEVKIPSFESRNHELIEYCDRNFKTIFMSTGTSLFKELEQSVKFVKNSELYLLHCVSTYPCKPSMANLPRMERLRSLGFPIGYSDHIEGVESAKIAIGEGATVIEKHFTVDKDLPGRDNKFAVLPDEMKNLTDYIRMREEMLTAHGDDFQQSELDSRNNYTNRFNGK